MKAFARALLHHFDREKRDLPWRRQPSAYGTLVSELMLQQTVVATVIPYFARFLTRFPDLAALAAADEAEVLTLWSGLGYYARARNLHRAARFAVERHGGALPRTEDELRALPGIGPYTAAAIAAIAFDVPTFPLDGNGARVFARIFAEGDPIDRPAVRVRLRAGAQALVPRERPGDFAQAVMDLGATICTPTSPRCGSCPVAAHCQAWASERQDELPVRLAKAEKKIVHLACAAIERRGRVLLLPRPPGALLAGTFALPATEGKTAAAALRAAREAGFVPSGEPVALGAIRHIFTHRDVTAAVYRVAAHGEAPPGAVWLRHEDRAAVALSSFARKTLGLVDAAAAPAGAKPAQRKTRMVSPATT